MKVLIACEESQAVCLAFRKIGHEAFSCDKKECTGGHPEWHIQGDVLSILRDKWDMIIGFPPCTHLSASGASFWPVKQKDGRQQAAFEFVLKIWEAPCDYIAIENPVGWLGTNWRKPDQVFHPYHFGDPYLKRTCLWLKGLNKLVHTNVVEPTAHWTSGSSRGSMLKDGKRKKSKLPNGTANSSTERSKTFKGVAEAMANQWGLGFNEVKPFHIFT